MNLCIASSIFNDLASQYPLPRPLNSGCSSPEGRQGPGPYNLRFICIAPIVIHGDPDTDDRARQATYSLTETKVTLQEYWGGEYLGLISDKMGSIPTEGQ